jgi:hypothetical protein
MFVTLLALITGWGGSAWAATVNNYTVDFNTAITTSNHDFAVARKWKHIVGTGNYDGYGPYYMSYSYNTSDGRDNSGSLLAYRQYAGDNWGGEVVTDLLVTPVVEGSVTLWVKAVSTASSSYPAYIELYSLNDDASAKKELLQKFSETIPGYNSGSKTEWVQLTYDVTTPQRIGIRAQNVYLDDFAAAAATFDAEASLNVAAVMNSEGKTGTNGSTTYFAQQADGSLLVKLWVNLENTGDVDFDSSTPNYTLTLATATSGGGTKTYYNDATVAIPVSEIKAGETAEMVPVEFSIPYTSSWQYYFVRENVTGTTSTTSRYAGTTAYVSKFVLREAGSTSTTDLTASQDYGMISATATRTFEIYNDGTAPLTVKRITLPDGFVSDDLPVIGEQGLVVGGKEKTDAFSVTLPATTTGSFSGVLTIVYADAQGQEKTKTLAFSGNVLVEGTWYADFNGSKTDSKAISYPEGSFIEGSTLYGNATGSYNSYDHYLTSYDRHDGNLFVTPRLHATAGATLTFDVLRLQTGSKYAIAVYLSADRKNWGDPVLTVANDDARLAETNTRYNYAITIAEEGDYYVAFDVYGMGLDNLVGLTKVSVAHDLFVKETKWDAEVKTNTELSAKLTIIPLTTESAGDYSVKFYVDGEAVATATSTALSPSATSTKDFTVTYTPADAKTTEHDTWMAVEFTDGTTFLSDHRTLKVLAEPYFNFISATATPTKWYRPDDYTADIDFGMVTETGAGRDFQIYNWGSAPLTVKSVTVPDGFSVSVSEATVGIMEGQPVTISFTAATPGIYSGKMTAVYVDADGNDVTWESKFTIRGQMLDASLWYADFGTGSNSFPAGSLAQTNVSVSTPATGNGALISASAEKNVFISPKMTFAAGDKVTFDLKARSSAVSADAPGYVKIYVVSDHVAAAAAESDADFEALQPVAVKEVSVTYDSAPDWTVVEFDMPQDGEGYLAYKLKDAYVDNIYGLHTAAVRHEWLLGNVSVPQEAMQNVKSQAVIQIQNIGMQAETAYTVTAIVDGEATTEAGTTEIPVVNRLSATPTSVIVNFRSPKTGTLPVSFVLEADDCRLETTPVNVTFTEETLTAGIAIGAANGTATDSPLNLNYKNSESVTLYNAATLASSGLKGGDQIKTITYRGYKDTEELTTQLQVSYEWTDDQTLESPALAYPFASEGMTTAISADHKWVKVGSKDALGEMLVLDFSDAPLTYVEGKSLRIYMHSYTDGYKVANFEKSTIATDYCYERQADNTSISSSWSKKNPAVIYLELVPQETVLAGTVRDADGHAVEGATVSLLSSDGEGVGYNGTTDADGHYSVNVVQGSRQYDVTVTKNGQMDFENGVSLKGDALDFVLRDAVTLDDKSQGVEARTGVNVVVKRSLRAGWNALVLPFDLTAAEVADAFGEDAQVVTYAGDEGTEQVTVTFTPLTSGISAGTPCLLRLEKAVTTLKLKNKDLTTATTTVKGSVFDFVGVYEPTALATGDYFVVGGELCRATTNNSVLPFRAYLQVKVSGVRGISFVVADEETTAIGKEPVVNTVAARAGQWYNLAGQRVDKPVKGRLYIVNGRKQLLK